MKILSKTIITIVLFALALIISSSTYAATAKISASNTSVYVGENVKISVSINAAAWNLSVSGNGINTENITGFNIDGVNQNTAKSYNLNTSSVGTYVVTLKGDISDGATDVTSDIYTTVTVTVKEKPVINTPTVPAPNTNSNTNTNNTNSKNNTKLPVLSSNAYLKEFRIDEPGMTPTFSKTTYNYAVSVDEDVSDLNIIAIPESDKATITINGDKNLQLGDNVVTVKVTAQDKKSANIYTIIVTKANNPEKSNAYLQSLFVENFILKPDFSSEVFNYELEKIEGNIKKLNISAFPINEKATVEIIGNENLREGQNNIKIVVTSENGEVQKTYNLIVNIAYSEENSLIDINNAKENNLIFETLKENAAILLLYAFVWIEFLQVVYLYEKLKKVQDINVSSNNQKYSDNNKNSIIKRIKNRKKK